MDDDDEQLLRRQFVEVIEKVGEGTEIVEACAELEEGVEEVTEVVSEEG